MTEDLTSSVQRELDALRHQYVAQLGERITEVNTAWDAVARASDPAAAAQNTAQLAHSLAGTSGVLGLFDVGSAAAALEEALDRFVGRGTPSDVKLALDRLNEAAAGVGTARSIQQTQRQD
jgi:HPt (histidine-containing phosphotransfer) domain-containing protein